MSPGSSMFSGTLLVTFPTPSRHWQSHPGMLPLLPHPGPSDLLPFLFIQFQAWIHLMPTLSRATTCTPVDLVPPSSRPRHRAWARKWGLNFSPHASSVHTMVLTLPLPLLGLKTPLEKDLDRCCSTCTGLSGPSECLSYSWCGRLLIFQPNPKVPHSPSCTQQS